MYSSVYPNFDYMKATVKIMLNPTRSNKDKTRTVSLRLTINRKRVYYSLDIAASETQWNKNLCQLNKSYDPETYKEKNKTLNNYYVKAHKVLNEIEISKKLLTHNEFRNKFFNISNGNNSVLEYYDNYIDDLKSKGKIGNAENYKQSREAFAKFKKSKTLKFEEVDVAFLNRWEKSLSKTCSGNGISNYMRSLRALYNRAISEEVCSQENYPFKTKLNSKGYDISKLETETIKRALSKDDLEKLKNYIPENDDYLTDAKNIFFFSFYTMGINIIDICKLKWSNIDDGRIKYFRSKNHKPHTIKIIEPVSRIINYYEAFDYGTDYIFPILKTEEKDEVQIRRRVKLFSRQLNRNLKRLGKLAEISNPDKLTTYVARHSFATTMKRKGVSTTLISEAMMHSDEKTTQIYLDSFGNDRVDEMNELIL